MLATGGLQGGGLLLIYVVAFGAMLYVMVYRPNQKEKKSVEDLMSSLAIGDYVLTASGFYGVIIEMTADMVIVEFGNNKNCRIPMKKTAVVEVEKPEK